MITFIYKLINYNKKIYYNFYFLENKEENILF